MGRENMITPELVKARLSYNHETGILTWKARDESEFQFNKQWNGKFAGKVAGTINKRGYVSIVMMLNGKNYSIYGHHAAWIIHYGSQCEKNIDHINGNTSDNRISNLRSVTHKENMKNVKKSKSNTSGYCGVAKVADASTWRAYITVDGKQIRLGNFRSRESAYKARLQAEKDYGFHANHGKDR